MEHLPNIIAYGFIFTTFITITLFYMASSYARSVLFVLIAWIIVQALVAKTGFYTVTDTLPPRLLLLVLPPLLFIIGMFVTTKGKQFIDKLDISTLTLLHTIRVPVELVLYGLFVFGAVPELMTFEGRNFDILSGLSAPLVYYFGFVTKQLSTHMILAWNIICLGLLINIVTNAVLSAPFPFQQFAFDQPNIAVLYFPFVWLPCCVVPLVLLSHLAAIKSLLTQH